MLEQRRVCTFDQLAGALGTPSRVTVFRKLSELGYLTSYSHRGKYYALQSCCEFDTSGLWSHRGIWFSIYGTLLDTCRHFVWNAPEGYSAKELAAALHVQTRQPLLQLLHKRIVEREKIGGQLIYLAPKHDQRRRQISARCRRAPGRAGMSGQVLAQQIKGAVVFFFGLLDERQRPLFAGLEALRTGAASDSRVAALFDIDPLVVANGRIELLRESVGAADAPGCGDSPASIGQNTCDE